MTPAIVIRIDYESSVPVIFSTARTLEEYARLLNWLEERPDPELFELVRSALDLMEAA